MVTFPNVFYEVMKNMTSRFFSPNVIPKILALNITL